MAVLLSLCEHRQQNRALKTEALLAVEALLLVCFGVPCHCRYRDRM